MTDAYTVMIVDDNYDDRFILKRYLKKTELPLVVMEASTGQVGIELLTAPLADLEARYPGIKAPVTLFLDINMPVMNGWEFVEELDRRCDEVHLNPTVVLMYSTSDATCDREKAATNNTISNYIVKGDSTPESLKHAILNNVRTG